MKSGYFADETTQRKLENCSHIHLSERATQGINITDRNALLIETSLSFVC